MFLSLRQKLIPRLRIFPQFIVISCIFLSQSLLADTLTFGSRNLNIPAPEGFVPIAKSAPEHLAAAQGYLPPGNRLVESYVTPDAARALAEHKSVALDRYFQLQTLRKVDGKPLSADDFRGATSEIEAAFVKALKETDVDRLVENGNAQVKNMTSKDPKLSLSAVESQGVYRREPWGIFFTVKSHLATSSSAEDTDLISAGALALINHQLMYLNGYAALKSPDDRRWVEQAVSAWADMVHAANPDDPAVAAQAEPLGFNWIHLRNTTLIGALLGALVGLMIALLRKRKA